MTPLHPRTLRKKQRRVEQAHGVPAYVSSLGARRRIEALATLGYSRDDLYRLLNPAAKVVQGSWVRSPRIHLRHHQAIAKLYQRIVWDSRLGPSPQAKLVARRNCWGSPMDWDEIDNPDEVPHCCVERHHAEALRMHAAWSRQQRRTS